MSLTDLFLEPAPIYGQYVRRVKLLGVEAPNRHKLSPEERAARKRAQWAKERIKYRERRKANHRAWKARQKAMKEAA